MTEGDTVKATPGLPGTVESITSDLITLGVKPVVVEGMADSYPN